MNLLNKYYQHTNGVISLAEETQLSCNKNKPFILVKIFYCGVCNSDIKEVRRERISRCDFGHEIVGMIISGNVSADRIGCYVTLDPHIPVNRNTGFSNYMCVSGIKEDLEKALIVIPSGDPVYVLSEPLACAYHAVNRLLSTGNQFKKILVYGAGTFGYLIYLILKRMGKNVFIGNRSKDRLNDLNNNDLIEDKYCDPGDKKYDAILLTGSIIGMETIESILHKISETATILLFGAVKKEETFNLYDIRNNELSTEINYKNRTLTMMGNSGATALDFSRSIDFIKQNRTALKKIITEISDLTSGLNHFQNMVNGQYFFGKRIIEMQKDSRIENPIETTLQLMVIEQRKNVIGKLNFLNPDVGHVKNCTELYKHFSKKWLWCGKLNWLESDWISHFKNEHVIFNLIFLENEPIGFFEVQHSTITTMKIKYIALLDDFTGRGLATEIMWEIKRIAIEMNVKELLVQTRSCDHHNALNYYLRHGFAIQHIENIEITS